MGIGTWVKTATKTQLAPLWTISLTTDSGVADLTGLTDSALSIYFKNITGGIEFAGEDVQGQGTLHIIQANPAIVSYQVATADVAIGIYQVRLWVAFSNGASVFDLGQWTVEP